LRIMGKTPKEAARLLIKYAALYNDFDFVNPPDEMTEEEYERRYGWADEVYDLIETLSGRDPWYLPEDPMKIGFFIDWHLPVAVGWTKKHKPRKDDLRRAIRGIEDDIETLEYLKAVCEELLKA